MSDADPADVVAPRHATARLQVSRSRGTWIHVTSVREPCSAAAEYGRRRATDDSHFCFDLGPRGASRDSANFALTADSRPHYYPNGVPRRIPLLVALCTAACWTAAAATWTPIGPKPITTNSAITYSGRVMAIATDPVDPNRWLIGAAVGGVWETLDGGMTWSPKTDAEASLAMGAIGISAGNPSVIYAGTGMGLLIGDAYAGAGVLKSVDGGANWQLTGAATFAGSAFAAIAVHPTNPDVVVGATDFYTVIEDHAPPKPPTGIFKTSDGGTNWVLELAGEATALSVDPTNYDRQYAGLGDPYGDPTPNGVYRSVDAGDTWTAIAGPWTADPSEIGNVEVTVAPAASSTVWVSIQRRTDSNCLGLWKTTNAWDPTPTWTAVPPPAPYDFCVGMSTQVLATDPANADVVLAGGLVLWRLESGIWTSIATNLNTHIDQQALAWTMGGRLVIGNDGGVFSSINNGASWTPHNDLQITQFYYGGVDPNGGDLVVAGSQDNGAEVWTGPLAWHSNFGGDGMDGFVSSSHPTTDWSISLQYQYVLRTKNGGMSYIGIDGIDPPYRRFNTHTERCPTNEDVVLTSSDRLWRIDDFFTAPSLTWTANSPIVPGSPITASIPSFAFAPSDTTCSTYAIGTQDGHVMLTTTGGGAWTDLDPTSSLPARPVTDLLFDPVDPNVAFATLSGFNASTPGHSGHVFQTTNALAPTPVWMDVSPPVNLPHNSIALDPLAPDTLYVGTDSGVWTSPDAAGHWFQLGPDTGMPNVPVDELESSLGGIFAFTHGRGAFKLVPFLVTGAAATVTPPSFAGTCPTTFDFQGTITTRAAGTVTYRWLRSDGAMGAPQMLTFPAAGSMTVSTSWMLGGAGTAYTGWQRLEILSPESQLSNLATFDLLCPLPVAGTKLVVKDDDIDHTKRKVTFKSIDPTIVPADATCAAPGGGGGRLRLFSAQSGQDVTLPLPCARWAVLSADKPEKGYRYRDKDQLDGPCKKVVVKPGKLTATCTAKNPAHPIAYDLTAGGEGDLGVVLAAPTPYCTELPGSGGTLKRDDAKVFSASNAPAPATCPATP